MKPTEKLDIRGKVPRESQEANGAVLRVRLHFVVNISEGVEVFRGVDREGHEVLEVPKVQRERAGDVTVLQVKLLQSRQLAQILGELAVKLPRSGR